VTDPNQPQTPDSSSSKPYISPKLREKLEGGGGDEDDEWSPKSGLPIGGIVIALLVVGAIVAGVIWSRSASEKRKVQEAAQARIDSLATIAREESLAVAAHADSAARADSAATRPGQGRPSASATAGGAGSSGGAASAGAAAPPAPATDGFGVAIGTYMSEDRANGERDRLMGVTGLEGLVTPRDDGGTTVYRVILGKFPSRAAAERRGQALMDSSLVREANVVARPKS